MTISDFAFSLFLQPAWVLVAIIAVLCAGIATGLWLAIIRLPRLPESLTPQAGFYTGVMALFALFMAFNANDAWRRGDAAYAALLREAAEASGLAQVIDAVPDVEAAREGRATLRLYLRTSLREEWGEHNAVSSQAATDALDRMRQIALAHMLEPSAPLWRLSLDRIEAVAQARQARLVAGGLYGDMLRWAGLLALFAVSCGALTVAHLNQPRSAPVAIAAYALAAAIALSVVAANEHPYAGWDGTSSDRLVELLARLG